MMHRPMNSVVDAIAFLRTIDVEVVGVTASWIVRGMDDNLGYVELTCQSDADLIDCARQERDARLGLCSHLGADWRHPLHCSCSSARQNHTALLSDWTWQPAAQSTMEVKT